jgi:hypothetical protein
MSAVKYGLAALAAAGIGHELGRRNCGSGRRAVSKDRQAQALMAQAQAALRSGQFSAIRAAILALEHVAPDVAVPAATHLMQGIGRLPSSLHTRIDADPAIQGTLQKLYDTAERGRRAREDWPMAGGWPRDEELAKMVQSAVDSGSAAKIIRALQILVRSDPELALPASQPLAAGVDAFPESERRKIDTSKEAQAALETLFGWAVDAGLLPSPVVSAERQQRRHYQVGGLWYGG